MLSNKWTFSLTSLVVLIAFGLVCACRLFSQTRMPSRQYDLTDVKIKVQLKDMKV